MENNHKPHPEYVEGFLCGLNKLACRRRTLPFMEGYEDGLMAKEDRR